MTESPSTKHIRNIEKFIDLYPERATRGYLVCRIPQPRQLSKRVLAIPFESL